jgi:hypothetical protein
MRDSLFEYVLVHLAASKGRWRSVSEGSGVPYRTLQKIARGEHKDPGIINMDKLGHYFRKQKKLP